MECNHYVPGSHGHVVYDPCPYCENSKLRTTCNILGTILGLAILAILILMGA